MMRNFLSTESLTVLQNRNFVDSEIDVYAGGHRSRWSLHLESRDVKRAELVHNWTVQTWKWFRLFLIRSVTFLIGFAMVMCRF